MTPELASPTVSVRCRTALGMGVTFASAAIHKSWYATYLYRTDPTRSIPESDFDNYVKHLHRQRPPDLRARRAALV